VAKNPKSRFLGKEHV
jgi:hypothetical protein